MRIYVTHTVRRACMSLRAECLIYPRIQSVRAQLRVQDCVTQRSGVVCQRNMLRIYNIVHQLVDDRIHACGRRIARTIGPEATDDDDDDIHGEARRLEGCSCALAVWQPCGACVCSLSLSLLRFMLTLCAVVAHAHACTCVVILLYAHIFHLLCAGFVAAMLCT